MYSQVLAAVDHDFSWLISALLRQMVMVFLNLLNRSLALKEIIFWLLPLLDQIKEGLKL